MEIINAEKLKTSFDSLIKTIPKKTDCQRIIKNDAIVYEAGKAIIIYKILNSDQIVRIKRLIKNAKYTKGARSNGIPSQSAIFGYLPRVPYRNDFCRLTADTKNQKKIADNILEYSKIIDEIYKELLPEQHELNLEIVNTNIEKDYIIKDTPFTTINFNVNHAIRYHRDTGNFKDVYSNVLIIKEDVIGGHLICPEYNIGFEQGDGALILFDGQKIIHGVTPIKQMNENGFRASCVFYSLATMKNCYPYKEELQRIKEVRDHIESRWRSDPNILKGYQKHIKQQKNENEKDNIHTKE
jgi:hypothetical protein